MLQLIFAQLPKMMLAVLQLKLTLIAAVVQLQLF
jgi:hypothetical protein